MSKNLNKGLAIGAAFALTVGGFATPASAGTTTLFSSAITVGTSGITLAEAKFIDATTDYSLSQPFAISTKSNDTTNVGLHFSAGTPGDKFLVTNSLATVDGTNKYKDLTDAYIVAASGKARTVTIDDAGYGYVEATAAGHQATEDDSPVFTASASANTTLYVIALQASKVTVTPFSDASASGDDAAVYNSGLGKDLAGTKQVIEFVKPSNVTLSASIKTLDYKTTPAKIAVSNVSPAINLEQIIDNAGDSTNVNVPDQVAVTLSKYTAAGVLDTGFDTDGKVSATSYADGVYTTTSFTASQATEGNYTATVELSSKATSTSTVVSSSASSVFLKASTVDHTSIKMVDGVDTDVQTAVGTVTPVTVRSGIKTTTVTAKVYFGSDESTATGTVSRVDVTVTPVNGSFKTGDTIKAGGKTYTVGTSTAALTFAVTSDSTGKVSIPVEVSATGTADKKAYTVALATVKSDGTADSDSVEVTYADTALSDFKVNPTTAVSGKTVTVTYSAVDNFAQPVSSTKDGALKVYVVAVVNGVETPTTFTRNNAITNGKTVVTFTNYLAEGTYGTLRAYLYRDGYESKTAAAVLASANDKRDITVYNNAAVSSVEVAKESNTSATAKAITYADFVEGDSSVTSTLLDNTTLVIGDFIELSGTVLTANGASQAAGKVTVSAPGVLFKDGTVYKKDSIDVYATSAGSFTVAAAFHKVNAKGVKVTFTADGKTASTLVYTKLPTAAVAADDTVAENNYKLAWSIPAHPAANATYPVTATVADKWGNAVTGIAVEFSIEGAATVNGGDSKAKALNTKGQATVYLRSLSGIEGPVSITATLVDDAATPSAIWTTGLSEDVTTTVWDETAWSNSLTADINLGKDAVAVAGKTKGTVKVSAYNATGKTIAVYVSGKKVASKKSTKANFSFTISKIKAGSKSVTVEVSGNQLFSGTVVVK